MYLVITFDIYMVSFTAVSALNEKINTGINDSKCICSAEKCRDDGEKGPRIGIALLQIIDAPRQE